VLLIVLLVVLVLAFSGGGFWGHGQYGTAAWSPLGLLALVLVVLWLTGNLHR
jgi:hypothetical protein